MKLTKKIIALILTVAMLSSVSVFAVQFPDVDEKNPNEEAINVLSSLGIIKGYEDGKFLPDKEVTRAELTSLLMRLQNLSLTGVPVEDSGFDDVANTHWAVYDIKTASNMGIIKGFGDGTFGPEASVTLEQAVKMVVAMLGYENQAIVKGGWPNGYIAQGRELGLLKKAEMTQTDAAPRKIIAQILYNSLDVDLMTRVISSTEENPSYKINRGKNLMTEYLKLEKVIGKVNATYTTRLDNGINATLEDEIEILTNNVPKTFKFGEYKEAVDMIGLNVVAYVKYDDNYVNQEIKHIMTKGEVKEITIDAKDIEDMTQSGIEVTNKNSQKNTKYNFGTNPLMLYNGKYMDWNYAFANNYAEPKIGSVTIVDSGNGFDFVKVESYTNYKVTSVDTSNEKIYVDTTLLQAGSNNYIDVPLKDIFGYVITIKKGTSNIGLSSIKKDNIISVKSSVPTHQNGVQMLEILVSDTKKTGKITETNDDYFTIGSDKYRISPSLKGTTLESEIGYNSNGTYYLDAFGDIANFVASAGNSYKYGYIIKAQTVTKNGETVGAVKLYDVSSKSFKTYNLNERVVFDGNSTTNHTQLIDVELPRTRNLIKSTSGRNGVDLNASNAQPVKYILNNSNKITELNTIDCVSNDDKNFIAGDYIANAKYDTTNKYFSGNNQDGTKVNVKVDSKTIIIAVPDNRLTEDEYSIKSSSYFKSTATYSVDVFELAASGTAAVIAVYGSNQDVDVHYQSPMLVVTEIKDVYENNENKTKVIGYDFTTGKEKTYYAENRAYLQGIGVNNVDVAKGDMIRFGVNSKGEINSNVYIYLDASEAAAGNHPTEVSGESNVTNKDNYPIRKVGLKANLTSRYFPSVNLSSLSSVTYSFIYGMPVSKLTEEADSIDITDKVLTDTVFSDPSFDPATTAKTLSISSSAIIYEYNESAPENDKIRVPSTVEDREAVLNNLKTYKEATTDSDNVLVYAIEGALKVLYIIK